MMFKTSVLCLIVALFASRGTAGSSHAAAASYSTPSTPSAPCGAGWTKSHNLMTVASYDPVANTCAAGGSSGSVVCDHEDRSECKMVVDFSAPGEDDVYYTRSACDGGDIGCVENGFLYVYES